MRLLACYFAATENAVKSERCLSAVALATERVLELRYFCSGEKAHERNSEDPLQAKASAGMILYIDVPDHILVFERPLNKKEENPEVFLLLC